MAVVTDPRPGHRVVSGDLTGLHRWASLSDAEDAVEQAERAGWRVVALDTDEADSAQGFLEACADAFGLPDSFRPTWDALDEALPDIDLAGARGLLVVWTGWAELADADPAAVDTATDVLRTAAQGWQDDGLPATVLVVG